MAVTMAVTMAEATDRDAERGAQERRDSDEDLVALILDRPQITCFR